MISYQEICQGNYDVNNLKKKKPYDPISRCINTFGKT